MTPYAALAGRLPRNGWILDLGCGHGLLALEAARASPGREVLGLDHDPRRIRLAREAAREVARVRFERGSLLSPPPGAWDGIALIDVMHYFDFATQRRILQRVFAATLPGGRLLVREVDPCGSRFRSGFNRTYERLATSIGFTRSEERGRLFFRRTEDWTALLRAIGFAVQHEPCSSGPFADVLFQCDRPEADVA